MNGATGSVILGPDNDGDVYESLGDKHKRAWNDFHSENGVRTVIGSIAGVKNGEWRGNAGSGMWCLRRGG